MVDAKRFLVKVLEKEKNNTQLKLKLALKKHSRVSTVSDSCVVRNVSNVSSISSDCVLNKIGALSYGSVVTKRSVRNESFEYNEALIVIKTLDILESL